MVGSKKFITDVTVGDSLSINGGRIVVTLEHKSGQKCRLRFDHDGSAVISYVRSRGIDQAKKGILA